MAEAPCSQAELLKNYGDCLAECRKYRHQVGILEREAQQWASHCLFVQATSRKTIAQLDKANGDLASRLAQAKDGKQQWQSQVVELKQELKVMDSTYQAAQEKIFWLKADKAQLLEDLKTQGNTHQKAITDVGREAIEAKYGQQLLRGQVAALKKELKLKDSTYEAAQAEILRLKEDKAQLLEDLKTQSSNNQKDLDKHKAINVELTSLVTQLQQQINEDRLAVEELGNIKADNSRLKNENSKLKTDNLRRLLDLGTQHSKLVASEKLLDIQKAELAARKAELDALAYCKVDLSRMRARVLNLHKQKEQWKAEEKIMHKVNQQLRGAVTQLRGHLQELQQTSITEQHTAVVEANRQLQARNLRLQSAWEAQRSKSTEYAKAAVGQKQINKELTKLNTELQQKIKQQEDELEELAIVKIDLIAVTDKLTKFQKLNESLKAKQQQMHHSNQQLQEAVVKLEHQLQENTSTMVQHTAPSGGVVAAAQAALKPVAVSSSNAGREGHPNEPITPELGDVSCSSS